MLGGIRPHSPNTMMLQVVAFTPSVHLTRRRNTLLIAVRPSFVGTPNVASVCEYWLNYFIKDMEHYFRWQITQATGSFAHRVESLTGLVTLVSIIFNEDIFVVPFGGSRYIPDIFVSVHLFYHFTVKFYRKGSNIPKCHTLCLDYIDYSMIIGSKSK